MIVKIWSNRAKHSWSEICLAHLSSEKCQKSMNKRCRSALITPPLSIDQYAATRSCSKVISRRNRLMKWLLSSSWSGLQRVDAALFAGCALSKHSWQIMYLERLNRLCTQCSATRPCSLPCRNLTAESAWTALPSSSISTWRKKTVVNSCKWWSEQVSTMRILSGAALINLSNRLACQPKEREPWIS